MRNALRNLQDNVDKVQKVVKDLNKLVEEVRSGDDKKAEPKISVTRWTIKQSKFITISDSLQKSHHTLQTSLQSTILSQL